LAGIYPLNDRLALAIEKNPPLQIESGAGIRVRDISGCASVDAVCPMWRARPGFAPDRPERAMSEQMARLACFHSFMARAHAD
jgi:adenosylmethionine-8-amino-7-oxononanoate aminotransferase